MRRSELSELTQLESLLSQGGKAHKVRTPVGRAVDSMLAVYKDRVTFTFVMDMEVASIHFDANRHEIFFKGHNISNMKLTGDNLKALWRLRDVLAADSDGGAFLEEYHATLLKRLADTSSEGVVSPPA